jgi:hypothetical protein
MRARHNASAVGTTGSVPSRIALPAALAPVVVALGVMAMGVPVALATSAARRGHAVGLRPLLMASELLLIVPALLALLLLRRPLAASLGLGPVDRRTVVVALCAGTALWSASLGLLEVQSVVWPPSEAFLELFRRLHAGGQTILMVTHDDEVAAAGDRIARMRDGRMVTEAEEAAFAAGATQA